MDAKPQRPLWAPPVRYGDENIPPADPTHQSKRSDSKITAMMAVNGTLNAPPKRAACFDKSNTSKPLADGGNKDSLKNRVKPMVTTSSTRDLRSDGRENNRSAAEEHYMRPTATSKAASHGQKYSSTAPLSSHAASGAYGGIRSHNAIAKLSAPVKKTTNVYRDNKDKEESTSHAPTSSSVDDLVAMVDKHIKDPRHYKSQPQLKSDQQHTLHRNQSKYVPNYENLNDVDDPDDLSADYAESYEDAVEQLSRDLDIPANTDPAAIVHANHMSIVQASYDSMPQGAPLAPSKPVRALPLPPNVSDPEEYSEDDDDQDLYDDQGYTTAHSYRSHCDNTTGGPTTLVAPKLTADIQKELDIAKAWVLEHQTEEEVEEENWDVSMVAEYGDEIFEYLRELEERMLPNPHYMDIQTEIRWSMRSVLMDWLVQVHHRFSLLPETLFLTVNYIDRFLSVKVVSLGKLQLVGATAIFVAAKYEEINCPSIQELVYMVDQGYSVEEILKAEKFMLTMLNFELGWPGPMSFLRRISKADDYDLETRTLAKYLLEVTIMDERFVGCPASYLAAGAHCLSRFFLQRGPWTHAHVHFSGYTLAQLRPLIISILDCCQEPRKHHGAVYDKYSHQRFKSASTFVEGKIAKGFVLPIRANASISDSAQS
ncbi:cyclin-like protein [Neurospora intermedia]|uniref:Cyclin-like protein n=1 Tax=Neurospora intermedia TaxID=5142 RepID=A0ABR3D286_NEUIN